MLHLSRFHCSHKKKQQRGCVITCARFGDHESHPAFFGLSCHYVPHFYCCCIIVIVVVDAGRHYIQQCHNQLQFHQQLLRSQRLVAIIDFVSAYRGTLKLLHAICLNLQQQPCNFAIAKRQTPNGKCQASLCMYPVVVELAMENLLFDDCCMPHTICGCCCVSLACSMVNS